jgi:hypothetical protein
MATPDARICRRVRSGRFSSSLIALAHIDPVRGLSHQFNLILVWNCSVLRVVAGIMNLSLDDVRCYLDLQLKHVNNQRLKSETSRATMAPSPPMSLPSITRSYSG